MQPAHGGPKLCCIAKRQVMLDIVLTVVRNGLRNLLPALSSFQPFPSEMFGVSPDVSNFQGRLPSGTPALFLSIPVFLIDRGAAARRPDKRKGTAHKRCLPIARSSRVAQAASLPAILAKPSRKPCRKLRVPSLVISWLESISSSLKVMKTCPPTTTPARLVMIIRSSFWATAVPTAPPLVPVTATVLPAQEFLP